HRDIMVHALDEQTSRRYHPYWYARVLGIFHCIVRIHGEMEWKEVPVLWIRWLGHADPTVRGSVNPRFLDQVGFVTGNDQTESFGFIDPANVIRACHLIPAFAYGETEDFLPAKSVGRSETDGNNDYNHFYYTVFVDRDMFMRFLGGGIGHI
ncbi:hypothetical protein M422DRAFT_103442, partial [Sphaerobolus stellatus SS14]